MPQKRLSTLKIKEVPRLHFELGLGQRQIALLLDWSEHRPRLRQEGRGGGAGLAVTAGVRDGRLEQRLFGPRRVAPERYSKAAPDFAAFDEQLTTHKHVTLQLLWEEYVEQQPDGYRYSRFCELYRRWRRKLHVTLRQQHRAGERLSVDYTGATVAVENPRTGESRQAQIFVAVLGASSYTYAEAAWRQQLPDWIGSHVRAFEYFGGAPEIVVPDNLRAGDQPHHQELAAHCGVAVVPARPRKPREKT